MKCKIDASIFNEVDLDGVAACIRDHNGCFVKASASWFQGTSLPQEAEAKALIVIKWVSHCEIDCKHLVDSIAVRRFTLAEFGAILKICNDSVRAIELFNTVCKSTSKSSCS